MGEAVVYPFEIEQEISEHERAEVKKGTLEILRRKYLQYKAEYLAMLAINDNNRAAQFYEEMRKTDLSYKAVESGL